MTNDEILATVDYLYEKYDVSKDFYIHLSADNRIRGMKGILVELDSKKKIAYTEIDNELIKDIFFRCC